MKLWMRIKRAWRALRESDAPVVSIAIGLHPLSAEEKQRMLGMIMQNIRTHNVGIHGPQRRMLACKGCPAYSSHLNRAGLCYDCVEKILLPIDTALGWAPKQHGTL